MRSATLLILLIPALAAGPATADDRDAGAALARSACAMCHALPDGTGIQVGPALADLAAGQEPFSAEGLRAVLQQDQHQPALALIDPSTDAAPLAAYLNSLQ